MSMTAVEKVLAAKSGKAAVRPGDVVFPDPDYVMIHDGVVMGASVMRRLIEGGADREPPRVADERDVGGLGLERRAAVEAVDKVFVGEAELF